MRGIQHDTALFAAQRHAKDKDSSRTMWQRVRSMTPHRIEEGSLEDGQEVSV